MSALDDTPDHTPDRAPVNHSPAVKTGGRALASWIEVLGSMRFAISSLSLLAIASIVGTVLNQREPFLNYVNQFGPFWAQLFSWFGIAEVYNAWWFLLVLAFLIVSTSLCVLRNSPKMVREMRNWRESVRVSSLRAQRLFAERSIAGYSADAVVDAQVQQLQQLGYRLKIDRRDTGIMIAGKRGATNRLGYIFAHLGIVVIALGGLLDSELPMKTLAWWHNKAPLTEMPAGEKIPDSVRLPLDNPSFRANLFVPEGQIASLALVNTHGGRYIQELPFAILLKQFRVEYYSTGMPKLFASDVVIIDKDTGNRREATIKVNEPFYHRGLAIYQSSFDDGGSKLRLKAWPLQGKSPVPVLDIPTEVGFTTPLETPDGQTLKLEVVGFRAINVENTKAIDDEEKNQQKFQESVAAVLSPSAGGRSEGLRNVGPSIQYKLRDNAGQAREFSVYQLPVEIDGHLMYLAGVRDSVNSQFLYLRIPADEKGELDEFFRLRAALNEPDLLKQASVRFANNSIPKEGSALGDNLMASLFAKSSMNALERFAQGGLQSVADFIEKNVAKDQREKASEMELLVLRNSLWELWQLARIKAGLPPAAVNETNTRFIQLSQLALSDSLLFGAPLLFQLGEFKEIKASVFQVTRSPGKNIVYIGCLALILGIFAMFYIRERRVWCWVAGDRLLYAMSSTRRSLAVDRDFAALESGMDKIYGKPNP